MYSWAKSKIYKLLNNQLTTCLNITVVTTFFCYQITYTCLKSRYKVTPNNILHWEYCPESLNDDCSVYIVKLFYYSKQYRIFDLLLGWNLMGLIMVSFVTIMKIYTFAALWIWIPLCTVKIIINSYAGDLFSSHLPCGNGLSVNRYSD